MRETKGTEWAGRGRGQGRGRGRDGDNSLGRKWGTGVTSVASTIDVGRSRRSFPRQPLSLVPSDLPQGVPSFAPQYEKFQEVPGAFLSFPLPPFSHLAFPILAQGERLELLQI